MSSLEQVRSLTDVDFQVADNIQLMEDNSSKYEGGEEEDLFD